MRKLQEAGLCGSYGEELTRGERSGNGVIGMLLLFFSDDMEGEGKKKVGELD